MRKGLVSFYNTFDNTTNIYDPGEWRLFIDSSKTSLKAVLLHNGNDLPSIPVGHAVHMKETYGNIKQLLRCINYDQHQWQVCGDLKVVALLIGLQAGYTKYCCFLCEWNSRARDSHIRQERLATPVVIGAWEEKCSASTTCCMKQDLVTLTHKAGSDEELTWSVVAERSSLPDSSSGVSNRMWVRIPAVTLVSLSKTLNHNCFSPPRG